MFATLPHRQHILGVVELGELLEDGLSQLLLLLDEGHDGLAEVLGDILGLIGHLLNFASFSGSQIAT
jgi:hypothetical protein